MSTKQERLESRIYNLATRLERTEAKVQTLRYTIGKLLVKLRDTIIPTGQWDAYIRTATTADHLGLSASTLYRCLSGYEQATRLFDSQTIKELAKRKLDPASPRVIGAALEVQATVDKGEDEKAVRAAMPGRIVSILSVKKTAARAKRKRTRLQRLVAFAARLYNNLSWAQIEKDLDTFPDELRKALEGVKAA